MPLIDGLVVLGAFGAIFVAALGMRVLFRKAKPEIQGAENAEQAKADTLRCCYFCKKSTDLAVDLYTNGHWYHKTCYVNGN